jgi:uncharacterized protein YndB with AHSA1/START domain
MVTLRHAIRIAASRADTFRALTDIDEMAAWHLGSVDGAIAPGTVLHLAPRPDLRFGWRTDALEPQATIVQTCVEGPRTSLGKTLTIALSDTDDDRTLVELGDGEWPEDDPHLPFCNTYWGEALNRLRSYLERTAVDEPDGDWP